MNGFLLVDKPSGISSFAVLKQLNYRYRFDDNGIRFGHGGTLDPLASGLLIIALGRATKLLRFFLGSDKRYIAGITFGNRTDTDDITGNTILTSPYSHIHRSSIDAAIPQFLGQIQQVPPSYSAIHVDGSRAYTLARRGHEVDLPARPVHIYSISVIDCQLPETPHLTLDIACSGGTYIRSIARDLGQALQSQAALSSLRRTHSCQFAIGSAVPLDTLLSADSLAPFLHTNEEAAAGFPTLTISSRNLFKFIHGVPVNFNVTEDGTYAVFSNKHRLAAILVRKDGKNEYLRMIVPEELPASHRPENDE